MEAIMISIQAGHTALIAIGKMTVLARKTRPKIEPPFKCYIYETKGRMYDMYDYYYDGEGKVVGEFVCNKIDKYIYDYNYENNSEQYPIKNGELLKMCLSYHSFQKYGEEKPIYGWHISGVKIYDTSKEVKEFTMNKCPFATHETSTYYEDSEDKIFYVWFCKNSSNKNGDKCTYFYSPDGCYSECLCKGYKPSIRPPRDWYYCEELEESKNE